MKRLLPPFAVLSCALLLSACAGFRHHDPAPVAAVKPAAPALAADGTPITYVDGVPVEKVPFRTGVSSATVEQLAKAQSCHGGLGAGLVSEPGPVEIYRMACDNGKTFIARCELRQCRPM
jgi:PBP1b-binding outer membrane lipoprotein LpoB